MSGELSRDLTGLVKKNKMTTHKVSDGKKTLKSRKVLIVSYHFPPDAEVGGLRVEKFAKYLPSFNWTPKVLTVWDGYYPRKDVNRGLDINCEVVRTRMVLSPREAYLRIKHWFDSMKRLGSIQRRNNFETSEAARVELRDRQISKLRKNLLSLLWIPDDRTGWIYPALKRGFKMIKEDEIGTLMTTSPPHSVQIIGLLLKKVLRKRWVVDFRDPWSLPLEGNTDFYVRINQWLEKKVVKNADVVIVATEVVKKSYAEKFCGAVAEKFVCVPNGYDSEDFKIALKNRTIKPDKLKISYLGEFYFGRTPEVFLQAVSDLIREGHVSREKISIKFIGNVRNIGRKSLESLVQKLDLSSLTEIIEPVPYHKAIECMVSSDVLLVFSPQAFFQPTKVFEYMFAEAWVIAFTPSGALSDVVRQYPKGIVVDYNDVEGAKKALMVCYGKFAEGNAKKGENVTGWRELLARYDRKNLTGELAKYL